MMKFIWPGSNFGAGFTMNIKLPSILSVTVFSILLAATLVVRAQIPVFDLEHVVIEAAETRISMRTEKTGTAAVKCPDCGNLRLQIDERSKVYIDQIPAAFEQARRISGGISTVVYDPENNHLAYLIIYTGN